jgi:hypothetical protein
VRSSLAAGFLALLLVALAAFGSGTAFADTTAPPPQPAPPAGANVPLFIALGDSITSGHHGPAAPDLSKMASDPANTPTCDDPSYGYPATIFADLKAANPKVWGQDPGQYQNLAHSGFGTTQVINGGTSTPCAGGPITPNPAPLTAAVNLLTAHKGAGNIVVISAGINDTNWVNVLTGIIANVWYNQLPAGGVQPSSNLEVADTPQVTAAQCATYMQSGSSGNRVAALNFAGWNGPAQLATIQQNVQTILSDLLQADPTATIRWIGYYNMAGTGITTRQIKGVATQEGPYFPANCSDAVSTRRDQLNTAIENGIGVAAADYAERNQGTQPNLQFLSTAAFMDGQNALLQPLVKSDVKKGFVTYSAPTTAGWPHPNTQGAAAIGNAVYATLSGPGTNVPEAPETVLLPALAALVLLAGVVVLRRRQQRRPIVSEGSAVD